MPRKIKVSDITPENNEKDPVNDEVEAIKETEPVEETQEKQEEKVEETIIETPQEIPQETPTEIVEETTKTRSQELRQCPKCMKWLTPKTLKYFHECTKNDTVKAKRRPPKKKIEVKDIEDIDEPPTPPPMPVKLVRQTNIVKQGEKFLKSLSTDKINYTPPVEISYEDMRRNRIKERIQQRAIKMSNLFTNAI